MPWWGLSAGLSYQPYGRLAEQPRGVSGTARHHHGSNYDTGMPLHITAKSGCLVHAITCPAKAAVTARGCLNPVAWTPEHQGTVGGSPAIQKPGQEVSWVAWQWQHVPSRPSSLPHHLSLIQPYTLSHLPAAYLAVWVDEQRGPTT